MEDRPNLSQIKGYLEKRSIGERKLSPAISHDYFGNRVFTSVGRNESIFEENHPSTMIVTPQGEQLVKQNQNILKQIEMGEIKGERIGGGAEGDVYKISLNTPQGTEQFAVKYTFYGRTDQGDELFTPGTDQLRMLQYLAQEMPVPGVKVLEPQLATINVLVTKYLADGLDYNFLSDLQNVSLNSEGLIAKHTIDENRRKQIVELVEQVKSHPKGMGLFSGMLMKVRGILQEVEVWAATAYKKLPFPLDNPRFSHGDVSSIFNILFSSDDLRHLFDKYKDKQSYYSDPEFRQDCAKCIYILEAGVGHNSK